MYVFVGREFPAENPAWDVYRGCDFTEKDVFVEIMCLFLHANESQRAWPELDQEHERWRGQKQGPKKVDIPGELEDEIEKDFIFGEDYMLGRNQKGQTKWDKRVSAQICGLLLFSAKISGFLRVFCENLHLQNAVIPRKSENQKKKKSNLDQFALLVCHL